MSRVKITLEEAEKLGNKGHAIRYDVNKDKVYIKLPAKGGNKNGK